MMKRKKIIYAIDFLFIVGSILILTLIVSYVEPQVIAPADNFETTQNRVLFEFEKAELILIDDNPEFSSPEKIYAEDNLVINLKPGVYYWKVSGVEESEVRELTVKSKIDLKLQEKEDAYEVVNSGNVPLNVEIYSAGMLVGNVVLEIEENADAGGDKFVGRENE